MSKLAAFAALAMACGDNLSPANDAPAQDGGGLPPTVQVISPNGGETVYPAQPIAVSWTRTDTNGGAVTYDVAVVDDSGSVVATIATAVTSISVDWTPSGVAAPTSYKVRVTVTQDGASTSDDSDAAFTVAPPLTGTSFARDVQPIFSASCLTPFCHTPETQTAQLILAPGAAYGHLVGVSSTETPCTSYARVAPSAPDQSYLLFKLAGSGPCLYGARMPKNAPALPAGSIATIRAWITEGALDN